MYFNAVARCTKKSIQCDACSTTILDNNYYMHVIYNGVPYRVHDNDGICLAKLRVWLGLEKSSFKSTRQVF
jgi:hypothetical protein